MDGSIWLCFLRALAWEIDSRSDPAGRDVLLRSVGRRMSTMLNLPQVESLDALEMEINLKLITIDWGRTRLVLSERDRSIVITHSRLPRIGSAGEPRGYWLGAVLEGLYEGWLSQQSSDDASFSAHRQTSEGDEDLVLRYARA